MWTRKMERLNFLLCRITVETGRRIEFEPNPYWCNPKLPNPNLDLWPFNPSGLLVERRTSVSQIRGSIPGQVADV